MHVGIAQPVSKTHISTGRKVPKGQIPEHRFVQYHLHTQAGLYGYFSGIWPLCINSLAVFVSILVPHFCLFMSMEQWTCRNYLGGLCVSESFAVHFLHILSLYSHIAAELLKNFTIVDFIFPVTIFFGVSELSLIFHRLVMDSFYLFTSEILLLEKDSFYNITYSWLGIDGIRNLLLICHSGKVTPGSFENLVKFGAVSRRC